MIKRLSFVLRLLDGFRNRALTGSEASIWVNGGKCPHEYKPNGYFVVSDLKEGEYSVAVKSPMYQTETMTIRVGGSEDPVRYLTLSPSESHPAALCFPRIAGRVVGTRELYIMRTGRGLKIAEDTAEAGNTSVKLFCGGARPRLPAVFRIRDRIASHSEIVPLIGAEGDVYRLGEPFAFSHSRASAVIPLIRLPCAEDGAFFFVVPPEFRPDRNGKIKLGVLAERGGVWEETEWAAESAGRTELGEIKWTKGG